MDARRCKRCHCEKSLGEFYVLKRTGKHYTTCKDCIKAQVKARYIAKPELVAAYERKRFADPERKKKALEYQRRARAKHPQKNRARQIVNNGMRDGLIVRPDACSHCGIKCVPEAHHHDYSKPFEVTWYCFKCHREIGHGQRVMC